MIISTSITTAKDGTVTIAQQVPAIIVSDQANNSAAKALDIANILETAVSPLIVLLGEGGNLSAHINANGTTNDVHIRIDLELPDVNTSAALNPLFQPAINPLLL